MVGLGAVVVAGLVELKYLRSQSFIFLTPMESQMFIFFTPLVSCRATNCKREDYYYCNNISAPPDRWSNSVTAVKQAKESPHEAGLSAINCTRSGYDKRHDIPTPANRRAES